MSQHHDYGRPVNSLCFSNGMLWLAGYGGLAMSGTTCLCGLLGSSCPEHGQDTVHGGAAPDQSTTRQKAILLEHKTKGCNKKKT